MKIHAFAGGGNAPQMRTLFLNNFRTSFPLADYLEFYPMTGNADSIRKNQAAQGGDTRDIDAGYTAKVTSVDSVTATLITFGDTLRTDRAHDRRGEPVDQVHRDDWESFAKSMGRDLMNRWINDGPTRTSKKFLGWKYLADASMKFKYIGDNGGQLLSDGTTNAKKSINALAELLDFVIGRVGNPTGILLDGDVISRMESNLKENVRVERVESVVGTPQRLTFYKEIPLIAAGWNADETTRVLPFTETLGTSTDCSSIYIFASEQKRRVTAATNSGFHVNSTLVGNTAIETTAEADMDNVLQQERALAVIQGIRLG